MPHPPIPGGQAGQPHPIPFDGMTTARGIAMNSSNSRSLPELFSDAVGQLAKLIGNEFELARAELSQKASLLGRAAALIGAGAVILMPALVLLLLAVSAALIRGGLSDPVAYLVTGAGAALVSAALIGVGLSRLSGDGL